MQKFQPYNIQNLSKISRRQVIGMLTYTKPIEEERKTLQDFCHQASN
ncbi:MAG: hypothetical protein JST14_12430 [Bacteroidetes bacterium]|nr:hypothetical protein [Bacteroidota bacterium]MBS1978652.1 hypothetical protein [Bacteroidota bacterium]